MVCNSQGPPIWAAPEVAGAAAGALPTTLFCTAFSFRLEPPIHASMMANCLLVLVTNGMYLRTSVSEISALKSAYCALMRA